MLISHGLRDMARRVFGQASAVRCPARRQRRSQVEALEPRTLLTIPAYVLQAGAANPLGSVSGSAYLSAHPTFGDVDGDGDSDLLVGRVSAISPGGLSYFENIGSTTVPAFVERTGVANPFAAASAASAAIPSALTASPALADWDADGDLDLLVATYAGPLAFRNNGNRYSPNYVALSPGGNPFTAILTPDLLPTIDSYLTAATHIALADLDGDSDLDLIYGGYFQPLEYLANTGTRNSPVFDRAMQAGVINPFGTWFGDYFLSPAIADLDNDGDLDVLAIDLDGTTVLENVGTSTAPQFVRLPSTVISGLPTSGYYSPALADLNGDGKPELLLSLSTNNSNGTFQYFQPVGSWQDIPVNKLPSFYSQKTGEDVALVFSLANGNRISVEDANAGSSQLQVTLTATHGTLTLATPAVVSFSFSDALGTGTGDGVADSVLTFRGTLTQINAALSQVTFQPELNFNYTATLSIATNDLGYPGGTPFVDSDSLNINVQSIAAEVGNVLQLVTELELGGSLNRGVANLLRRKLQLTGNITADVAQLQDFLKFIAIFDKAKILPPGWGDLFVDGVNDIITGLLMH